jgi:hypothetical protein
MAGRGRRAQWLTGMWLLAVAAAAAAQTTTPPAAAAGTPQSAAADTAELLLYLSEFEDAQGEWIDPAELPPPAGATEEDDDAPR